MKKFFQNIKFKKISLTTLALALVVSGFLVWGNTEAATTAVSIDTPISGTESYVQQGRTVEVQFDVTTDAEGVGTIIVEIYDGTHTYQLTDDNYNFSSGINSDITKQVSMDATALEGSYDVKVTVQQPGGSNTQSDTEIGVVIVDNTPPTVESVSVNDESIAEGDVGTDKFVVTVNFDDTNPMDMVTNPAITFDPTLDATITNCSNSWTDSNTFTYTCDIADADIESADIDIQVSGAKDAAGNTMSGTFTESDEFDVDTIAPTVTATISPSTGTAKVGDTIIATLTAGGSQADLNLSGTCTINGVDVIDSFVNNTGGTYTLSYEIEEAETDRSSGNLPVSCTLVETSGNTVTLSSFEANTLVVDANSPAAPVITSIAGDDKINDSEKGAVVIIGTAEATANISGTLTGEGDPVTVSGTADGSGNFSITVNASGLADGTLSLSITATDAAGNVSTAGTSSAVKDIIAPTGYSVTFDQAYVNNANKAAISFTFAGAEVGATYNYSIDDTNAETSAVTGTGTISTSTDQITGIDVSTLDDETLTITVTLTDPAGNVGAGVTDTIVKDIVAPTVTSIVFDDTALKIGDTATVTIVMSEAVTGFDKDDVTAPNGTLGDLSTENNITFTGTFTPNASTEDTTNVAVVGTGFTDVALNPALTSAGATSANYAIDTLGPRRGSRSTTTTTTTVTDPITTPTTPTAPTAPTPYFFSTTMRIGSYAGEVLPLQQFLASKGYFTDTLNGYFGQTTFLAVKAYQKANGLGDDGIVGPMTRSVLNGAQNPSVPSGPTTPLTPSAYTYNFGTKLLMNGSRGDDVKELQRFLNKALGLGLVEDGILGPKTIGVIKEWQKSQGLKDDGIVGPLTKAKMLELAKGFK